MCTHGTVKSFDLLLTVVQSKGPSDTCSAKTEERELTVTAKAAIVDKHNELRRKVAKGEETNGAQPAASNMRKLVRCF